MTKKTLNQNVKYAQNFLDCLEFDFNFNKTPSNRFNIIRSDNHTPRENKKERLSELIKKINSIENCKIKNNSSKLILGNGNINSPIMIIGETPGSLEEESGLTFQGDVGLLLNKMFMAINIELKKIYSTYSINFRPPKDRKPTTQEINHYSTCLKDHISIINPELVILLGSTAMEAVTGLNGKISEERGKWKEIILENKTFPILITYSPSYLIKFPEYKKYSWEDLKKIKRKIQDLKINIK